ncbi:shikimate dehydrogenase [Oceanobacillus halophilus]|uniref:Shikimate dehydrogenase (NADP(+)) n=1 Tax=Oceanobacillus halophilus TaxID=930130 RepID=A0A495ADH7_9BACI|nr:shikimate dehydrogenase [Oceanobacillus halophilus]RKQ37853.1 shikimate dehydrogenase [Oceanobacillus halophilus]
MGLNFQLIGYPIKHSLSPWIHQQFLRKANLEGTYVINEITPSESVKERIEQMKRDNVDGFNVTIPYKQEVIPYLDKIDDSAKNVGAVNTVLNKNGKLIGYNTDSIGYVRSLENKYPSLEGNQSVNILLLGAGGAARGIYYGLYQAGYKNIDIANRTQEKAVEIAKLGSRATTRIITLKDAEHDLLDYDVIIQTTSVGMKPNIHESIISIREVKPGTIVSDIVYQPIKTDFLTQAEVAGAKLHFGHTMLLYQAQYAFEIWTGETIQMEKMDKELQQILEGR